MFKKNPLFAAWDPLALEIYVDCQIYEDGNTGEAKLKMAGVWVCGLPPSAVRAKLNVPRRRLPHSWRHAYHLKSGTG